MDLLNRFSVKVRVIALLALFLFLLTSLGIFTLQRIHILHNLTETLYNHPLQVSNAALRAKAGVIRMHRSMKDVALSKTQLELQFAIGRVLEDEKVVYQDLELVKQLILGEEGKKLVGDTVSLFAGWKPIRFEVEELVIAGKRDEASKITRQKGADYVAALERQMNDLTSYAHNKADGFMNNAQNTHQQIENLMIVATILVAAICLVATWIVIGGITSSIIALQEKMAVTVAGGALQKVEIRGNNEFTSLAKHFNSLITTVDDQLWLRENLNTLNQQLKGDLSLDELLETGLSCVTRTIDGCAGALYLYDKKSELCTLRSSFAFVESNYLANSFKLGEGLVGQAALEKLPILLKNISKRDAIANSGTMSEPPVGIYTVPVIYEKQLLAVLEVAFFEELSPIRKQFVDEAEKIIGAVLHTSMQADQIKGLFLESQEANEALALKSHEINVKNEELNALNQELQAQATELQVQKNELELKRSQVEEADRLKSEFLSNMSHELRTPLNSILSLSQLLIVRGVGKDPDTANEYLRVIDRNGRQLLSLINDILDLTKIESGRMDLFPTTFSLDHLVSNLFEIMQPLASEKQLTLKSYIAEDIALYSDEDKIHQILINFLSNAIKFTDNGTISLDATRSGEHINFAVIDEGIGISEENLDSIFDEFRQVDGSFTRAHDGTGLGLAISKKLALLLGGKISVTSQKNVGSTFTLTIPMQLGQVPMAYNQIEQGFGQKKGSDFNQGTVLVIDDDEDDRIAIMNQLHESGYQTIAASTGKEGLALAKINQPDVISLDLIMPVMDGWEVLNALKADPETCAIPVIIISSSREEETSMALGAAGSINKPVDTLKLMAELSRIKKDDSISRVLVVDDDLGVRQLLEELLSKHGYQVELAANGEEGLEKYMKTQPDLIILDLLMPVLDGFGFLEKLRIQYRSRDIPIVILTSKDLDNEDRQQLSETHQTFTKHKLNKKKFLEDIAAAIYGKSKEARKELGDAPHILVIEDNDIAGDQIKIALEENGFSVELAKDGEQGLKQINALLPDAIVLDLMMPKLDGFTVLERLRSQPETVKLPTLILTAKELSASDRQRLSHNNVHQLIQKGATDRDQLVKSVRRMIQSSPMENNVARPLVRNKRSILIVEDNPDNRLTMSAILNDEGFHIMYAEDGKKGVDLAQSESPDLILMDIQLPVMSGIEALREIKNNGDTSDIPVMAITAKAMKGDKEELLSEGFDDYIQKPVNPIELKSRVLKWFDR